MRRIVLILLVIMFALPVSGASTPAETPITSQVVESLPESRSYDSLILLSAGVYAIGGERSLGSQPWNVEPCVEFRGSSLVPIDTA